MSEAFAIEQDAADLLGGYRAMFCFPEASGRDGRTTESLYFVGNSLGLMPKATRGAVEQELDDWARLGVEAHFHGKHPWMPAHEEVRGNLAGVVGALPSEVVAMNSLTTNLHLLMVSFYRPTAARFKIVIEDTAFPSDSYAVQSQLDFHARAVGFDAQAGLIRLKAREGETALRTEDIVGVIDREKDSIALVMLGGVNYLTGQCFDMAGITAFARERGIVVGWDLAHAAGNIPVKLHEWGADFAAWCSYKYLNSGPGAVAGAFVHERHHRTPGLPRFHGWWGSDPATRFKMGARFEAVASADAWQLSNPPIMALTPLRVSLEIFARAGMGALRAKSERLTGYLERLLGEGEGARGFEVLTPRGAGERGCQLSLRVRGDAKDVYRKLGVAGVFCDFREPDVIRVAPVPLYNSFRDVWRLAGVLRGAAM